jgi:hypothetical protein
MVDNFILYHSVMDAMMRSKQHPESIVKIIREMHDKFHDDYTEESLHELVYDLYEAYTQSKFTRIRPISTDVENYIKISNGSFSVLDCFGELGIKTPEEKSAARMALSRFCDKKIIERVGTKDGIYRKIATNDITKTQFIPGDVPEFPIILPIDLNLLCKVHAKNIIIVAGTKSSGKTAFLMKIALENQARIPVVYLNSEMGDEEFSTRMKNFGVKSAEEIQYETIECHNNFHDHITDEKKVFLIDFLEVHDKFYEVAGIIRLIHEKLRDGICIIAIQKADKAVLGRGAEFSMEKSRIYLNIDYIHDKKCSRFTIADAKMPKRMGGVKGAFRHVKLINGARFSPVDDWNFPYGDKT